MHVRDTNGNSLFVMDGDVGRDESGKPFLARTGSDDQCKQLCAYAGAWLQGKRAPAMREADGKILMDLGVADVAQQATRAQFAIPSGDFVADAVSEVRMISHDRGYLYVENVTDAIKIVAPNAPSDGPPPLIAPGYAKTAFVTTPYALASKIPRDVAANGDWDVTLDTVHLLVNALRLAREVRLYTLLTTAANWATANQISIGVNKWNGGTAPAPLANVFSGLAASYLPANIIVLPESVAPYFYGNPFSTNITLMRDYVQSGGEMPKVLFARAKQFTGGAPAYVWAPSMPGNASPTNVALVRAPDSVPTTVTLRWLGNAKDGEAVDGVLVRRYTDPVDKSDYVVVAHNDVELFVNNKVGALLVGAIS
ncbi:MAG TPA: hypothetical protein VK841_09430 [Polyangiaceae bacterium]|jgi:hypothetical protein|nr:hypothetical protein [Polyangiaceae bacterium]